MTSKQLLNILKLRDRGGLFIVNHSGGKDSQAMLINIRELVPHDQILVIHARLPGVDWEGTEEHVYETAMGLDVITVQAGKTFFEMVEHRGMWPSPKYRQCTSDLKRGPIEKGIRGYLKANPQFNGLVINCMGIRAEESSNRAKSQVFKYNKRNSKAGREWYDWLPIHCWLIGKVFKTIADAGQQPHWAYRAGMTRLSCCFCIMASRQDLVTAARLNPDLYKQYVDLEKKIDHTFIMPRKNCKPEGMEIVTGVCADLLNNEEKAA